MALGPIVYTLPVHNEEALLAANVERVRAQLAELPGSEVFLVENGSRDRSWEVTVALEAKAQADGGIPVRAFREPLAGIGYAYHRGLTESVARFGPSTEVWALLTAADLPFGFSDLAAARSTIVPSSTARFLMGSKAHPDSRFDAGVRRRLMTAAYRAARRLVLGMRVGDSQGTLFLRLDLAAALLPNIKARGFFYSTELCYLAERGGDAIVELPVSPDPVLRASSIRPFHDGLGMARELMRLRRESAKDGNEG